jgi:hypothetical protein
LVAGRKVAERRVDRGQHARDRPHRRRSVRLDWGRLDRVARPERRIVQAGLGRWVAPPRTPRLAGAVNKVKKPQGAKGRYINRVVISSTLGPGLVNNPFPFD